MNTKSKKERKLKEMKKTIYYLIFSLFLVFVLAACGTENSSKAESGNLNLKSADVVEKASPHTKGMLKFAEDLEEKSNGEIKMKHYSDGQLGDEEDIIEGVKSGSIDFAATGVLPGTEIPGSLGAPFLFESEENLFQLINSEYEELILDRINEEDATKNLKVIGLIPNMTRVITTKGKEIRKPEDIKNLKIRVPEEKSTLSAFKEMGANPSPLAFTELYTSLQTGVIEAQENPYQIIYDNSFYEIQDTIIETNHAIPPRFLIVNEKLYDSLSAEQVELIKETWREAELYMEELITNDTEDYIEKLKEKGMNFIEPDVDAFNEATKETQEYYIDILGEDIFNAIKEFSDN